MALGLYTRQQNSNIGQQIFKIKTRLLPLQTVMAVRFISE